MYPILATFFIGCWPDAEEALASTLAPSAIRSSRRLFIPPPIIGALLCSLPSRTAGGRIPSKRGMILLPPNDRFWPRVCENSLMQLRPEGAEGVEGAANEPIHRRSRANAGDVAAGMSGGLHRRGQSGARSRCLRRGA